jgi:hypothetical protein
MQDAVSEAHRLFSSAFISTPRICACFAAHLPARGGEVNVYATALKRSEADQRIIKLSLQEMLSARGGVCNLMVERNADCQGLLGDYGTTLLG